MCTTPDTVDFNVPDDVIRYIVDNNPNAVRNNLSKAGLNAGGLTPCLMKDKLIALNNQGYDIKPILKNVPFNKSANNYTTALPVTQSTSRNRNDAPMGPNPDGTNLSDTYDSESGNSEHWLSGLGNAFAGLGVGIGSLFGGSGGGSTPIVVQTPKQDYLPFIMLGAIILIAVFMLKK